MGSNDGSGNKQNKKSNSTCLQNLCRHGERGLSEVNYFDKKTKKPLPSKEKTSHNLTTLCKGQVRHLPPLPSGVCLLLRRARRECSPRHRRRLAETTGKEGQEMQGFAKAGCFTQGGRR
jgi:hypothetical protein